MVNYSQLGTKEIELTNYDVFMMNKNKKKAESQLFDRRSESSANISYEKYKKKFIENQTEEADSYKAYLMEQLERKSPEKILSIDEFYSASPKQNSKRIQFKEKNNTIRENKPSVMSRIFKKLFGNVEIKKGGKFFIAFYVLIIVAVASILIVMNTTSTTSNVPADAVISDNTQIEAVQPMSLEVNEEKDQDWFDKMCDSLNK